MQKKREWGLVVGSSKVEISQRTMNGDGRPALFGGLVGGGSLSLFGISRTLSGVLLSP